MSTWIDRARAAVRVATADLAKDATLKDRRAALRPAAARFHGGTSWGKKKWAQAAREYLEAHGQPRRKGLPDPLGAPLFAPDIVFPWKGESDRDA